MERKKRPGSHEPAAGRPLAAGSSRSRRAARDFDNQNFGSYTSQLLREPQQSAWSNSVSGHPPCTPS